MKLTNKEEKAVAGWLKTLIDCKFREPFASAVKLKFICPACNHIGTCPKYREMVASIIELPDDPPVEYREKCIEVEMAESIIHLSLDRHPHAPERKAKSRPKLRVVRPSPTTTS